MKHLEWEVPSLCLRFEGDVVLWICTGLISRANSMCFLQCHLWEKVHKAAQWIVQFMTNFTPAAAMTSLLVLSSPLGFLQFPPIQTPLQQQMLSNFHHWPVDLALCWKAVAALNSQILLLVYLRQWRALIPWLNVFHEVISIISQTSW